MYTTGALPAVAPHHAKRSGLERYSQRRCASLSSPVTASDGATRHITAHSAAARLLPPAAPLSALATCQSHHAAALSCSAFAAASRTTQRIGDMLFSMMQTPTANVVMMVVITTGNGDDVDADRERGDEWGAH